MLLSLPKIRIIDPQENKHTLCVLSCTIIFQVLCLHPFPYFIIRVPLQSVPRSVWLPFHTTDVVFPAHGFPPTIAFVFLSDLVALFPRGCFLLDITLSVKRNKYCIHNIARYHTPTPSIFSGHVLAERMLR